jgi:hypothetical protein
MGITQHFFWIFANLFLETEINEHFLVFYVKLFLNVTRHSFSKIFKAKYFLFLYFFAGGSGLEKKLEPPHLRHPTSPMSWQIYLS